MKGPCLLWSPLPRNRNPIYSSPKLLAQPLGPCLPTLLCYFCLVGVINLHALISPLSCQRWWEGMLSKTPRTEDARGKAKAQQANFKAGSPPSRTTVGRAARKPTERVSFFLSFYFFPSSLRLSFPAPVRSPSPVVPPGTMPTGTSQLRSFMSSVWYYDSGDAEPCQHASNHRYLIPSQAP